MKISKKSINCSFTGEPDSTGLSEGSLRDAQKSKTWQEVYKQFEDIVDKYMPDAKKIEKEVYNLYAKNKGLKQYQEAYDHWMDEADFSIEDNEDNEIESSTDIDEETEDPKWICLDIKHVRDSDGMLTDYALYTNQDEDKYICMFGDTDVYPPDEMYADAEFDTENEALEWFENYTGPGDEEDDIYSSEETDSEEDNDNFRIVYHASLTPVSFPLNFNLSKEVGLHCGTLEQATTKNGTDYVYKVTLKPSFACAHLKSDTESSYGSMEFLYNLFHSGIIDDLDFNNLLMLLRDKAGDKDKQKAYSKIYRDFLLEKEFKAFDYPNTVEGTSKDKSICIIDNNIIADFKQIDMKTKNEDYDLAHPYQEFDSVDTSISVDENDVELDSPEQEFTSENTSINKNKLPAVYRLINIPEGSVGIDFGGGKWDTAVEYIRDLGATLCVYDPYNRTAQHNREMLKTLKANGGADWAVNSNVLNVIKEPEARQGVLTNISKITKSGAPIYITVYEGRGDAKEGPTKSGYQLNRKTQDYLEEIQEVFPDAKRKGKLIVAHNVKSASSSTNVNSSENILPIDELNDVTDKLRDDLIQKLIDVMTGPNFGFPRNDVLDYSRVDIGFDDDENRIEVEVGAEVSYDGLMQIAQELDPIIESYDHDAYFDAEDAGLLVAVIPYESLRKHTDVNSAVDIPEPSLDPPEYDDPEEGEEKVEVECDINQLEITVDEDGSWEYQRDDFLDEMLTAEDELTSEEYDVYVQDRNGLIEDFDSIVEPNIPGVPGTYLISCHVKMVYDITGVEIVREYQGKDEDGDPIVDEDYYTGSADVEFNKNDSYITDFYSEEI